jgi:predicted Ser/Thr protein kinase
MGDDPRGTLPLAATVAATPENAPAGTLELPASDRVAPASELGRGAMIGHFVIDGRLGGGGMGVVYAGRDVDLGRPVAIKLVRADVDHPAYHARLLREAQVMARLEHPNVVRVYEIGSDLGRLFVAMELVDGLTLTQWLRAEPRSTRDVVAMFRQIGAGLAAVHEAGLVHRDFKPDNVLVDGTGRARVADFGLARIDPELAAGSPALTSLTQTGMRMGTPGYMAPEQQVGSSVDVRADQYSYCVALREALVGGRGKGDERWQQVPPRLRAIVTRGLSYEAADRFASMADLVAGFDAREPRRRWPIGAAIAAVITIGIVAIVVGTSHSASIAPIVAVAPVLPPVMQGDATAPAIESSDASSDAQSPGEPIDAAVAHAVAPVHAVAAASTPHRDAGAAPVDAARPDADDSRHAFPPAHLAAAKTAFGELGYRGLTFEGDPTNDVQDLRDKLAALPADQPLERGRLLWALGVVQRKRGSCADSLATIAESRKPLQAAWEANHQENSVFSWFSLGWLDEAMCDFAADRLDATLVDLDRALRNSFAVTELVHMEILLAIGILEWETRDPERGKATVLQAGQHGDARLRAVIVAWAKAVGLDLR